ncbi:hypothetical protein [Undibacterium sp. SXout20W]|uniref:RIFT barrel domain-containing protein n=1 Tax=Undibacterium sp. SXout20W TaxID=3413051 RepID=UPI003BF36491
MFYKSLVLFILASLINFFINDPSYAQTSKPRSLAVSGVLGSVSQSVPITTVKIQQAMLSGLSNGSAAGVPVTFGQVFAQGDVPNSSSLSATLQDGTPVVLQVDKKATHPDGSMRHAVITAVVPLDRYGKNSLLLSRNSAPANLNTGVDPTVLLNDGFKANVQILINGETYIASADDLLRSTSKPFLWLSGPLVNEWQVSAPLKTASGKVHPQLSARFAIRSYTGLHSARVDVALENDWAYAPAPQNITYHLAVTVGGQTVYSKSSLQHYHHSRWRKTFWWGNNNNVAIAHDTAYLISTKAVPNYDQTVQISPSSIQSMATQFSGAAADIMGNGLAVQYMPTTGGRNDIGLLPGWAVSYLLSMNDTAKKVTLGTADMSGSWSMHYRNQNTDRPVSLIDFPYMTLLGRPGDTYNPQTKKNEAFPVCGGDCTTPFEADSAHEPALAYLPYLVTGDYYYLEELQFWTMYDLFQSNPGYRNNVKGLFHSTQVRAQAWTLRDLSYAAYITPDADMFKSQFAQFLSDNLDWYNASHQPNGSQPNIFGALVDGDARQYVNLTSIAPWQDDFFTSAVGRAVELGFDKAKPLLAWKAQFPVKRMIDPGYCWIGASVYTFQVTNQNGGPFFTDMSTAYLASNPPAMTSTPCDSQAMAASLGLNLHEMVGYSSSALGYPSNLQPALALSANSGITGAKQAWALFNARAIKPDYSGAPQFAIVPRN